MPLSELIGLYIAEIPFRLAVIVPQFLDIFEVPRKRKMTLREPTHGMILWYLTNLS